MDNNKQAICQQYSPENCKACAGTSEANCVKTHPWIKYGLKYPDTTECDKLNAKREEWNAIYPFVEWLYQQKKITLAQWRDAKKLFEQHVESAKETGTKPEYKTVEEFSKWHEYLLSHPYPLGMSDFERLLYEYFEVDVKKLEQERRALLEFTRQLHKFLEKEKNSV